MKELFILKEQPKYLEENDSGKKVINHNERNDVMDYTSQTPMEFIADIVSSNGFQYRIKPSHCDEFGCSGPFIYIMSPNYSNGILGLTKKQLTLARIQVTSLCEMQICGDNHKQQMIDLATQINNNLHLIPINHKSGPFDWNGLKMKVEFVSHKEQRYPWPYMCNIISENHKYR